MKKVILLTTLLLTLFACSKDENENKASKFSAEETEILKVLNGKWEKEGDNFHEMLSFAPYGEKKTIHGSIVGKDIIGIAYGDATYRYGHADGTWDKGQNMYFNISADKKEIHMYGINEDGSFSVVRTKQYDYNIVDNNTIQMHDKSLSAFHAYNYKRIR
jgi:hypothetical protein